MSEPTILAFDTTLTSRGFAGHEMLDPVALVLFLHPCRASGTPPPLVNGRVGACPRA
jgi:hypothetical protein